MKKNVLRFNISLIALLVYEVASIVFGLDGLSASKLFLTGLVWVSFFVAGNEYFIKKNIIKKNIPYMAYILITLLLLWNVLNVFRSLINRDGSITTILGNVAAALSVLVPFVIVFSIDFRNLRIIHSYYIKVLKVAIPVFLILLVIYGTYLSAVQLRSLLVLFVPVAFLITALPYYSSQDRVFVLVSAVLLLYISSLHSVRTMIIRLTLLFLGLLAVFLYGKFKQRSILYISCLGLLIPIILLQQSYVTGQSAFDTYLSGSSDSDLSIDTRTFLYTELFEDLQISNRMLIGKGANGSYYSEYFNSLGEGETDMRNNIEVGILGILLKGGLFAVFLNIGLLIIAIYVAFFRSRNLYTVSIGYILLIHTFLLFLENYIVYSGYNFAVWFFMGVCLSKKIRSMSDREIKMLIQGNKRIHRKRIEKD